MRALLAIDGGGSRGIIPTRVLAALQERLALPLARYFDLVAGTSSGAISALALAQRNPVPASALTEQFMTLAPKLFSTSWSHRLTHFGGLLGPKYQEAALEQMFAQTFGNQWLSQLPTPVLVPALDIQSRKPMLFSQPTKGDKSADFKLADVLRATTAAPTFFRPAEISSRAGHKRLFVDGGLFANNPAMYGVANLGPKDGWLPVWQEPVLVLSIGTGHATRPISAEYSRDWGSLQWIKPVIQLMGDGLDDATDYAIHRGFEADHYFRFQIDLSRSAGDTAAPRDEIDNCKPENLNLLKEWGDRLVNNSADRLDRVAELLLKSGARR